MIKITLYFNNGEFTTIQYEGTYEEASKTYLGQNVSFKGKMLKITGIDLG